MQSKKELFLILHNIRSLYNVGAIFRSADGAGVSKMYLTGYTPEPIDALGRTRKEIAKTALGAEKAVSWEHYSDIGSIIKKLKKEKVSIVALELHKKAVDYKKFKPKFPLALILGNEVRGVSKQTLKKCDTIIQITMKGKKESLNVGVAAGIAMFSLR